MNNNLLQKLKEWRRDTAQKEGVDLFRVLSNVTIENIAFIEPKTKGDLMSIKGIKERKFEKYGLDLLALVNGDFHEKKDDKKKEEENKPYSIGRYIAFLNSEFTKYKARVQGEISSLDIRDGYIFFTLKDKTDESTLSCFMWRRNYDLCGISLEAGMEVIVEGVPEIYAPSGRFSFKASIIELVGEGALKKAYNQLKQRLENEGLFDESRKMPLPEFPRKIGLITSETGAVIHDFLNNLGKYGFKISFVNSRVEGLIAVQSLLAAIKYFKGKDIDVLVIIRGGGSLESLQAFNNEFLVREIANFKIPVICGIGHDKDVPLASLAADMKVSTPTAVTTILNRSWEKAVAEILATEKDLVYKYQRALDDAIHSVESFPDDLKRFFKNIIQNTRHAVSLFSKSMHDVLKREIENKNKMLDDAKKQLEIFDPARQLKLGYSIAYVSGRVVKTVKQVSIGENMEIRVSDGGIESIIKKINN